MKIYKTQSLKRINNDHGFTLIEVMVALMLIAIVFVLVPSNDANSLHNKLTESIENVQRAVRFSTNESILRNSIVRITFKLGEASTSYYIEASEGSSFFLDKQVDTSKLSISEREKFLEDKKKQDQQFQKVEEYSEKNDALPEGVNVVGIGSHSQERIQQDEEIYIYFYPSGEKDSSIIFFTTDREMATLETSAFEDRFKSNFVIYSNVDSNTLESTIQSTMDNLFNTWIKD